MIGNLRKTEGGETGSSRCAGVYDLCCIDLSAGTAKADGQKKASEWDNPVKCVYKYGDTLQMFHRVVCLGF